MPPSLRQRPAAHRRVAIKQLLLNRVGDERVVKRFVQEARVAASLEHPNVVTIYSLRIDGNRFFIIMEYLPHGSLQNLIDKRGRLTAEQAIRLTTGICEGLAKLHEYGVIHRDIKAPNILLAADGRPKIIDFGIAHVPEMMGGMALTQVGFQPSTLIFSSPEQVRGKAVDQRSDVYQVGQLLYYMLTGQHYIDLKNLQAQIKGFGKTNQFQAQAKLYTILEAAICEEMPRDMQKLWREVGVLAGVVEKAMAKDPADRFASILDFAAALKAINISASSDVAEKKAFTVQDSRTYNRRGLAHVNMRNYEQAIYDYSKAIELDRHFAEAYNNRSAAHLMMENYAKAVLDCNWTLELAPHFISAYVNLGIAHTGLRQYAQALKDYAQALQIDPNNIYAFYNRGNTRIWMKDFEGAVQDFNTTIRLDPEFVAAYVNRGVAYTELKAYEPALVSYSQSIELNPNYVYAFFNRANLYRETGHNLEAIADYSKVIELNPQHHYAHENRGDCYTALGQEPQAAADFARMAEQHTSAITPKRMSVARSMLMPATPLDFLTPKHDSLF